VVECAREGGLLDLEGAVCVEGDRRDGYQRDEGPRDEDQAGEDQRGPSHKRAGAPRAYRGEVKRWGIRGQ